MLSVCIANYKQDQFLREAIASIEMQTYKDIEICIYNDTEGVGSGEAFNRAIAQAKGDYIVLLCADDYFTDAHVVEDIVGHFDRFPDVMHVSRYYYQFVDGDKSPVRAWRNDNVIELANNPSGLAFRKSALQGKYLSNKMFVEAPSLVSQIVSVNYMFPHLCAWYVIMNYDTIAVRVHKSTARSKGYYQKMWKSSPVEEWAKLGWKTNDFTHLIQVANYYTRKAVVSEISNFLRINPLYIINPVFVFFAITALCTPRAILLWIPEFYRSTFGRLITRQVMREKK